jgi:hypothetical protein
MRIGFFFVVALVAGAGASPLRAEVRNPFGVAVIIGNKTYQDHDIPEVSFADRDAQAIKSYVIDVLGYAPDNILYIENATQGQLLTVFGSESNPEGKLANYLRPGKKSDVLVYYSGHGVPAPGPRAGDAADAQADLLPADADPSTLGQNGFPVQLLLDNLRQLDAKSVTVLLDACFSGMSGGGTLLPHASVVTRPATPVTAGEAHGLTVITAAGADQLANWDTVKKHGLFTEYFLEAVYGRADDAQYGGHGDGKITLGAVEQYLDDEMSYVARRQFGRRQKATVTGDAGTVLASLTPDRLVKHDGAAPTQPTMIATPSTPQPVAFGPKSVEDALKLSPAERSSIQQSLTAIGYATGGIDGVFGPGTRTAVTAYQRKIGAAATGFLTRDVLAKLERETPARPRAKGAVPEPAASPVARTEPESILIGTKAADEPASPLIDCRLPIGDITRTDAAACRNNFGGTPMPPR